MAVNQYSTRVSIITSKVVGNEALTWFGNSGMQGICFGVVVLVTFITSSLHLQSTHALCMVVMWLVLHLRSCTYAVTSVTPTQLYICMSSHLNSKTNALETLQDYFLEHLMLFQMTMLVSQMSLEMSSQSMLCQCHSPTFNQPKQKKSTIDV